MAEFFFPSKTKPRYHQSQWETTDFFKLALVGTAEHFKAELISKHLSSEHL